MILSDKSILVTGASRGIGAAIARALAAEGALVGCLATTAERAQGTVDQITQAGGKAIALGADVSDEVQAADAMKAFLAASEGAIYGLVNNAGITKDGLLLRMKPEDFDRVIAVNLRSAFLLTQAALKPMIRAREGRILNISSVNGLRGAPGQANYAASKAGLIGFSKSVAREAGSRGITCNVLAPGFIETDMTEALPEEMRAEVAAQAPLGRLGTPEDIAQAALFLLSPASAYITGQVLAVDGGLTM
jgi:3-oxoacyl-[acyl-carrier protein] reductase